MSEGHELDELDHPDNYGRLVVIRGLGPPSAEQVEMATGEKMRGLLARIEVWQSTGATWFWLDIEETCEVLEPLLRAALGEREE